MTYCITATNVNDAFLSGLWWLRTSGVREESRNGPVLVAPGPVITTYSRPWERVLFLPQRDANHVFHLLESLWMLTGSDDVTPLIPFNSGIVRYTEDGAKMHGAYGFRWRRWQGTIDQYDQIPEAIHQLKNNRDSRQVVLSMWDPQMDLTEYPWKDRPCNTHIYFDCRGGKLNVTVCCRSNDMLWGAYGANVVHMSILQEVIAAGVGVPMGVYRQFSNNFHLYTENEMTAGLLKNPPTYSHDEYNSTKDIHVPLIGGGESVEDFLEDCQELIWGDSRVYRTKFIREVADPLKAAYAARKSGEPYTLESIRWCDWKLGFKEWVERRNCER
jgi:hypothetical protein